MSNVDFHGGGLFSREHHPQRGYASSPDLGRTSFQIGGIGGTERQAVYWYRSAGIAWL